MSMEAAVTATAAAGPVGSPAAASGSSGAPQVAAPISPSVSLPQFDVDEAIYQKALLSKALGNEAFSARKYEEALQHFGKAIELYRFDYTFYSNRCATYMELKMYPEALMDANFVVALYPTWPKGFYRKGIAHMKLNQFQDAFSAFYQGLQLDPESEPLKQMLQQASEKLEESDSQRATFIVVTALQTSSAPPACSSHTATLVDNQMIVLGGSSGSKRSHSMYTLNIDTKQWSQPYVTGSRPNACLGHSATVIGDTGVVLVFGGWDDNLQPRNDVFLFDVRQSQWTKPDVKGAPPPRRAWHTAVYVPLLKGVLVFGGRGVSDHCFNDLHLLETETMTWKPLSPVGIAPAPRGGHTMTLVGNNCLIWGGYGGDTFFNDMCSLRLEPLEWQRIATLGYGPSPRAGHTACRLPDNRIIFFGGDNGRQRFNDLYIFDLQMFTWQPTTVAQALPSPRCVHSACISGARMYVFGGADLSQVYNDTYLFDLDQLAQYEINPSELVVDSKLVGKGGTALVYKGKYRGETVAVKKFHAAILEDVALEAFRRETCMMTKVRHPQVLQLIGISTQGRQLILLTEWAQYGSLYDVLAAADRIPLSYRQRLQMCLDAAVGMEYLHSIDIIHRDLKSLNLLVTDGWRIKVADFGLARVVDSVHNSRMTRDVGTPHWSAPELLLKQAYGPKADVYSFGITMWEVLTRAEPFDGLPQPLVISRVVEQDARPEVPPEAPISFVDLMQRCWQRDPDARPTFTRVVTELLAMSVVEDIVEQAWSEILGKVSAAAAPTQPRRTFKFT